MYCKLFCTPSSLWLEQTLTKIELMLEQKHNILLTWPNLASLSLSVSWCILCWALVLISANLASLSLSVSWSILCWAVVFISASIASPSLLVYPLLTLSLMLARLTLLWSSLSLLLEVLVYDHCFFNLATVDSPVSDPLFPTTHFFSYSSISAFLLLFLSHFYLAYTFSELPCEVLSQVLPFGTLHCCVEVKFSSVQ